MKMKGNSLIEIMLSLFLASLIFSTLLHYYFRCQQAYYLTQKNLEESLELQYLSIFLQDSIRRAGFSPCLSLDYLTSFDRRSQNSLKSLVIRDKAIKISRMSENFYQAKRLSSKTILLPTIKSWQHSFPVLIADCYHAEVLKVQSSHLRTHGLELRFVYPLKYDYEDIFYLGEWIEEEFSIEKTKTLEPALFYQTSHKEKLTNLVKDLSIEYLSKATQLIRISLQTDSKRIKKITARVRA